MGELCCGVRFSSPQTAGLDLPLVGLASECVRVSCSRLCAPAPWWVVSLCPFTFSLQTAMSWPSVWPGDPGSASLDSPAVRTEGLHMPVLREVLALLPHPQWHVVSGLAWLLSGSRSPTCLSLRPRSHSLAPSGADRHCWVLTAKLLSEGHSGPFSSLRASVVFSISCTSLHSFS